MARSLSFRLKLHDTIYMSDFVSLENNFLIAMPMLADPNFEKTVTLICQHSDKGALGVVINRTTNLKVSEVLEQLSLPGNRLNNPNMLVHFGGPVQTERGLILHDEAGDWDSTLPVSDSLCLTTSKDILEAISENKGPENCLLALGYAGWGDGQLERELSENTWLSGPADNDIIFHTPIEERWPSAAALLGVDIAMLSTAAGHA